MSCFQIFASFVRGDLVLGLSDLKKKVNCGLVGGRLVDRANPRRYWFLERDFEKNVSTAKWHVFTFSHPFYGGICLRDFEFFSKKYFLRFVLLLFVVVFNFSSDFENNVSTGLSDFVPKSKSWPRRMQGRAPTQPRRYCF